MADDPRMAALEKVASMAKGATKAAGGGMTVPQIKAKKRLGGGSGNSTAQNPGGGRRAGSGSGVGVGIGVKGKVKTPRPKKVSGATAGTLG